MDPLSGLSVAAAVVQFVDFGTRLLKGTREVYISSSGQSAEVIELSTISMDLTQLFGDAESKLRIQPLDGSQSSEDTFCRLCRECAATKDAIQEVISKLQARGHSKVAVAASSFAVALRRVLSAGELEALTERLDRIRQQAMMAVLCLLLGEAKRSGTNVHEFAEQQAAMIATLDRIDQTTTKFSEDVVDFIRVRSAPHLPEAEEMVEYIMSDTWFTTEYMKYIRFEEATSTRDQEQARVLIRALFFNSIGYREADIPLRYAKTFEWVFKEPKKNGKGRPMWSDFPKWLQGSSDQIYWVRGKPGAGKSTLIKFIARDARLRKALSQWANDGPLFIARFFSWTAGADKLQKTQEGLLRTLLHEVLSQRPALTPRAFPARWFLLQLFQRDVSLPKLKLDELMSAFRRLLPDVGDSFKLALVIDGLDEFGDDHGELVQLLNEANKNPSVKICVSSRPWNVFNDEYKDNPVLQLENLTRDDIALFVKNKFSHSRGYREFEATNPATAKEIIGEIVDKADGVFLWVSVVSGLLESSFQEGYKLAELQATVTGLPSKVSDLFRYIWDRTSRRFRAEASEYFHIMRAYEGPYGNGHSPYSLVFWLGDSEVPIDLKASEMNVRFIGGAVESVGRRLTSRTGGLLEMFEDEENPRNSRVGFLHRTARDWVDDNWTSIGSSTDKNFDPIFWILKGEVLRMAPITLTTTFWDDVKWLLLLASQVKDNQDNRAAVANVLDRFDRQVREKSQLQTMDGTFLICGDDNYPVQEFYGIKPPAACPHWCNALVFTHTNGPPKDGKMEMRFLDLAGQLAIVPYIKYEVERDPVRFNTPTLNSRLLEHIIFGHLDGTPIHRNIGAPTLAPSNLTGRLDLLEFVLKHGTELGNLEDMMRRVTNEGRPNSSYRGSMLKSEPFRTGVINLLREHTAKRKGAAVEETVRAAQVIAKARKGDGKAEGWSKAEGNGIGYWLKKCSCFGG